MAAPDKTAQETEALARATNGVGPGESTATQVIDDGAPGDVPAPGALAPADGDGAQRPAPIVRNANDDKRSAIVNKFRGGRTKEADEASDEISDFARSGLPADFAAQPAPAPAAEDDDGVIEQAEPAAAAAAPVATPQKVKVKVHGVEREVDLDQIIDHAQRSMAADNILDAAKSQFKELETLVTTARNKVGRTDQQGQHQAQPTRAQAAEPDADAADPDALPQHQGDDRLGELLQEIQFGSDPEKAKELLRNTIASEAQTAVAQTMEQQRFIDEGARTAKVLKDFEGSHPEIAKDSRARAAIEADILDLQRKDIEALGIDPTTLRPDGAPPTPGDIANAHRWYRTKGFKVTAPGELLETATKNFLEWKGVKPAPTPADPAIPAQQRVDVTVDRTARRAAIPQQPNRTATAQPAQQQQQPAKPRDRSAIVRDMVQKRSAPRGRIVA